MKKRILFISHDASLSGAPFVLLYLLQWLKKNTAYTFDVLLLKDGPIRNDFAEVAEKIYEVQEVLFNLTFRAKNFVNNRSKKKIFGLDTMIEVSKQIDFEQYSIIYGNTNISLPWLVFLKQKYKLKVICAIHELKTNMEGHNTREFLTNCLPKLDLIIAGSAAVSSNLINRYNVSPNLISVVHAFIHQKDISESDDNILRAAGVQDGQFVIGAVGNPEWRKGTDLFIHIAISLKRKFPDFNFNLVWIGGNLELQVIKDLISDFETCGLNEHFTFVQSSRKYLEYIKKFDVFAMLSREDPFPLVCLEASYLEKPIVMFNNTGGTAELLVNGGGFIVPYLEIEVLSDQIYRLYQDVEMRGTMGKLLKKEVVEKYNSDVLCHKVAAIIDRFL